MLAAVLGAAHGASGETAVLWVAESKGVLRVSQEELRVEQVIPVRSGVRAVAADPQRGLIWALGEKSLLAFDRFGNLVIETTLVGTQGNPTALRVDSHTGVVWTALNNRLFAFDPSGQMIVDIGVSHPIAALAVDSGRSAVWLASKDRLELIDSSGGKLETHYLAGAKSISALAYAPHTDQLWIVADDSLRVRASGQTVTTVARGAAFAELTAIALDGDQALWAMGKRDLLLVGMTGEIQQELRPFADEQPDLLVDIAPNTQDGSVWVASPRSLARVAGDGIVQARFTPYGGGKSARILAALAVEQGDAGPRIEFVSPGQNALLNTAQPELVVAYSGADLDLGSLSFLANGQSLHADCSLQAERAQCVPRSVLAQGPQQISVRISTHSGITSDPASVNIRVDTQSPVITVTSPQAGFLTKNSSLTLSGHLSETAALTVNGTPATVQDLQFSFGPVTLAEGENQFLLQATDAAGNTGVQELRGTLDTTPPAEPIESLIRVDLSGGQIVITGESGSVEAGARVTVTNRRTGQDTSVVADATGAFGATLAGAVGDELEIFASDAATNQGASLNLIATGTGPFSGPVQLSAVTPADGATVAGDLALISFNLQAPPNSGVTVNGIQGACEAASPGLRCHAAIPLELGASLVTIRVHVMDGRLIEQTTNLNSLGPFPYQIVADRFSGMAPLDVEFEVLDRLGYGIRQVQVDFDNDGVIDYVSDGTSPISTTYSGTGHRQATVIIFDNSGQGHFQTVDLVLQSAEIIDEHVQAIWSALNDALVAGDSQAALAFLSGGAQEQYGPIFEVLLPDMPAIVASYSVLRQSLVYGNYAEYGVNRMIDGVNRVFLIGLVTNEFGQWQLDSM